MPVTELTNLNLRAEPAISCRTRHAESSCRCAGWPQRQQLACTPTEPACCSILLAELQIWTALSALSGPKMPASAERSNCVQGVLLQIFTQPLSDRPTVFLEIIQRIGCTSIVEQPDGSPVLTPKGEPQLTQAGQTSSSQCVAGCPACNSKAAQQPACIVKGCTSAVKQADGSPMETPKGEPQLTQAGAAHLCSQAESTMCDLASASSVSGDTC